MKLKLTIHLPFQVTLIVKPLVWQMTIPKVKELRTAVRFKREPVWIHPSLKENLQYRKFLMRMELRFLCLRVQYNWLFRNEDIASIYPKHFHYLNETLETCEYRLRLLEQTGYFA